MMPFPIKSLPVCPSWYCMETRRQTWCALGVKSTCIHLKAS